MRSMSSPTAGLTSSELREQPASTPQAQHPQTPGPVTSVSKLPGNVNREQVYQWIQELASPETREHALIELSRKREVLPDLAPMLWHSFGTMAALLQEIVMIYPVINPPTLTVRQCPFLGTDKIGSICSTTGPAVQSGM